MSPLVTTATDDGVAHIRMDDGKANALSPAMQTELRHAFDRAEADDEAEVIVLHGRDRVFSGGFDLSVMGAADETTIDMVIGGFTLARHILTISTPVVMVSRGHAIAMGAFLLLSGDLRLAAADHGTYQANEVAIGLTLPHAAGELLRARLAPAAFDRAAIVSTPFTPGEAQRAGFVDELVDPDLLDGCVAERAASLRQLDATAHAATKQRMRAELLSRLDRAIDADRDELSALFAATH